MVSSSMSANSSVANEKWMRGTAIARGKSATIYSGLDTVSGELVVIKEWGFQETSTGNQPLRQKVEHEIKMIRSLSHPHIVRYLDSDIKHTHIAMFTENMAGGDLEGLIKNNGALKEAMVRRFTKQIIDVTSYLHSEGILHRSLIPSHILLSGSGTCKVAGFGSAVWLDNIYGIIETDQANPCPVIYVPPETLVTKTYNGKSEMWTIGCTILELLSGKKVWTDDEAASGLLRQQLPPINDAISSQVSPEALSFLYDCFTIDPFERPTAESLGRTGFLLH